MSEFQVSASDERPAQTWIQFARFIAVGLSNTAISFALYAFLLWVGMSYVGATIIALAAGAANGYFWNSVWTFRTRDFGIGSMSRYLTVQALGMGVDLAVVALAIEGADIDELVAQAIGLPVMVFFTFVLNRRWTFARA